MQRHHTETLPSQIASITTLLGKGRASFCKHSDYCFLNFCRTYLTPFVFMLCRHPSSFSKPESFLFQTPCPADSAFWKKQVEIPLCFGIAHVLRLSSKICKCPVVFRLLADCPVPWSCQLRNPIRSFLQGCGVAIRSQQRSTVQPGKSWNLTMEL